MIWVSYLSDKMCLFTVRTIDRVDGLCTLKRKKLVRRRKGFQRGNSDAQISEVITEKKRNDQENEY